ncbi:MAG: acyl carrier protein [Myxococcota bacterium]
MDAPSTTDREKLFSKVRQIVASELKTDPSSLNEDTDLREWAVESIVVLRIAAALEKAYDIELPDEFVFRARTLGELANEVSAQHAGAAR